MLHVTAMQEKALARSRELARPQWQNKPGAEFTQLSYFLSLHVCAVCRFTYLLLALDIFGSSNDSALPNVSRPLNKSVKMPP